MSMLVLINMLILIDTQSDYNSSHEMDQIRVLWVLEYSSVTPPMLPTIVGRSCKEVNLALPSTTAFDATSARLNGG
jgi:hypothetical protein